MEKALITLLLLCQHVRAQVQASASPGLEPSTDSPTSQNSRRPTEVIVVAVLSILLFVAFYFIYLCCCIDDNLLGIRNWSNWRRPWNAISGSHRRHSPKWDPYELDPNVVKSFPKFEYEAVKSLMIGKGNLECAVCLMEFNDKDVLRLIPRCDHVFHAHCVDEWLISHGTCPVCRLNLTNADLWVQNDSVLEEGHTMRSRSFSSGRSRLIGRLSRSLSTGHVEVEKSKDVDKHTLRLPWEVRNKIISVGGRSKSESWVYNNLTPSFRKKFKLEDLSRTSLEESSTGVVTVEPTQLPV